MSDHAMRGGVSQEALALRDSHRIPDRDTPGLAAPPRTGTRGTKQAEQRAPVWLRRDGERTRRHIVHRDHEVEVVGEWRAGRCAQKLSGLNLDVCCWNLALLVFLTRVKARLGERSGRVGTLMSGRGSVTWLKRTSVSP